MSVVDAFQDDTDESIRLMSSTTPPKIATTAPAKASAWRGIPDAIGRSLGTAVPAAAAESIAGIAEIATATARGMVRLRDSPNDAAWEAQLGTPVSGVTEFSQTMRDVAASFRPDPLTSGTAENVVYGLVKTLPKAIGYTALAGPLGGAAAFATDEGLTTLDELQAKGVDPNTASQVAGLTGLGAGASILIPQVGPTVAKTIGLTLAGGPGLFAAQQAATSDILSRANYSELAAQYDPLDPVGLTVSTLIPAVFAGAHIAGLKAAQGERTVSRDVVDAAMVHNLTLHADATPTTPVDVAIDRAPGPPPVPETAPSTAPAPRVQAEQQAAALQQRVAAVEQAAPDMAVHEDGTTAAKALEAARKEAHDGTDEELGHADADLVRIAAECAVRL